MNAQQLSNIVTTVSDSQMISGNPGDWSLVPLQLAMAAARTVRSRVVSAAAGGGGAAAATAPAISAGEAALIPPALDKSNAAAVTTPSAAGGTPVTSNTPPSTIQQILQDLNVVGEIGADISALEGHGKAMLHWWGWEADLDETGTKALSHLLTTDMKDLAAVAAALAAISPVLAAVSGIISIVSGALAAEVSAGDAGNGVVIKGYLWVGIAVSAA